LLPVCCPPWKTKLRSKARWSKPGTRPLMGYPGDRVPVGTGDDSILVIAYHVLEHGEPLLRPWRRLLP